MNCLNRFSLSAVAALLMTGLLSPAFVEAQLSTGTSFAHQGSLRNGALPASGSFDFQFALFNAATAGSQVGSLQTMNGVSVAEGLYSVNLDFGDVFNGQGVWLEIRVRETGTPSYTTLAPRRAITPVPYALYAAKAETASTATKLESTKLNASTIASGASGNYGEARFLGPSSTNMTFGARSENRNLAGAQFFNENSDPRLDLLVTTSNTGLVQTYGSNNTPNAVLSAVSSDTRHGYIGVYNSQSSTDIVGELLSVPNKGGRLGLFDFNGDTRNVVIEPYSQDVEHGYIGVYDRNNSPQVEIFVDTSRRGVVVSDLNLSGFSGLGKSETHAYSTLLGPELGVYQRGTAQLVNGTATVALPSSFADVAAAGSVTAHLTPADPSSLGVAVVSLSPSELVIRELQGGTGNYAVHYMVFGERNDIEPDKDGNRLPAYLLNQPSGDDEKTVREAPVVDSTF